MLACWSLELLLIAQMLTRYHGLCCFFHLAQPYRRGSTSSQLWLSSF
jgi:hypothetical protein